MSKYRTHSEIIDAIRLKCARAYWSEDSLHPNGDIPEIKCLEPHKLATLLESAHKREVDDLKKQIALLSKTLENDNSATATITTVKQKAIAAIANEIRARAGAWPDEKLKQYDLRLADRIDEAAKRERTNLDALERACEEVLDAESLKAVIVAKRRIEKSTEATA